MGKGFIFMHHYCWALGKLMRIDRASYATNSTKRQRDAALEDVLDEFDFLITNLPTGFVVLPEILQKKGAVLARLRRDDEAVKAFQQSAAAKEDYAPAYAGPAALLLSRGKVAEAKAIVEEGLRHAPDSKSLKSLLNETQKKELKTHRGEQKPARINVPAKASQPPN